MHALDPRDSELDARLPSMRAPRRTVDRPLSPSERWYWVNDQISSISWFAYIDLALALSERVLRQALSALLERHPLLRTRIEVDARGRAPRFVSRDVPEIPLRFATAAAPDEMEAWLHEAEVEIHTRIDTRMGPLARAVVVAAPGVVHARGRTQLLLVLSHIVADGLSGALLVEDFVRLCGELVDPAGARPHGAIQAQQLQLQLQPLESLLPASARGARGMWRIIAAQLRGRVANRARGAERLEPEAFVPFEERRTRLLSRSIDAPEFRYLTDRCAETKTTVHGAISAALSIALAANPSSERSRSAAPVRIGSPVNLRKHLIAPVDREVGVFVSSVVAAVSPDVPFWEAAAEFNRQMSDAIQRGEPFAGVGLLRWIAPANAERVDRYLRLMEREAPGNVTLSNLGRLSVPERIGALTVSRVAFGASLSVTGYLLLMVSTFGDRLQLTFGYVEHAISSRRAANIADVCVATLRAAATDARTLRSSRSSL